MSRDEVVKRLPFINFRKKLKNLKIFVPPYSEIKKDCVKPSILFLDNQNRQQAILMTSALSIKAKIYIISLIDPLHVTLFT